MDSPKFLEIYREHYGCPDYYYQIKRLDIVDYDAVNQLHNDFADEMFGNKSLKTALLESYCTLGIETITHEIVALISFSNTMNMPAVNPDEWENALFEMYAVKEKGYSTMFIHYIAYKPAEENDFLKPILHALFFEFFVLANVYMLVPPKMAHLGWLVGMIFYAKKIFPPTVTFSLRQFRRKNYAYIYETRFATEGDNDDVIPLIETFTPRLTELYGPYYVAEIVQTPLHQKRKIIVVEFKTKIIGVMFVNRDVNYEELNCNFNLACFNYIKSEVDDSANWEEEFFGDSSSSSSTFSLSSVFLNKPSQQEVMPAGDDQESSSSDESLPSQQFSIISAMGSMTSFDSIPEAAPVNPSANKLLEKTSSNFDSQARDAAIAHRKSMLRKQLRFRRKLKHRDGNAFAIEILALVEGHEDCVKHLLEHSFRILPNEDYAVITIPSQYPSALFEKFFVRVPPRPESHFPQVLYVVSKHSLRGEVTARAAEEMDKPAIHNLIATLRSLTDDDDIPNLIDTPHEPYVFFYEDLLIGYAVVRPETNLRALKKNFNLRKWNLSHEQDYMHGRLEFFTYSPIFQNQSQGLLRELHRHSGYNQIYYVVEPKKKYKGVATILENLMLARPYQPAEYPKGKGTEELLAHSEVFNKGDSFALFFSAVRTITMTRIVVNEKILVVGAGITGISFLMGMITKQFMDHQILFSNLTLVSRHAYTTKDNEFINDMFLKQTYLTKGFLNMYSFDTLVNKIFGTVTQIDRPNKRIKINDKYFLYYDYLVLTVGEQYQTPNMMVLDKGHLQKQHLVGELPKNLYVINDDVDAAHAIVDIVQNVSKEDRIILYGYSVEVYSCIATLLKLGVLGHNILYIRDRSLINKSEGSMKDYLQFNYHKISTTVDEHISQLGIKILHDVTMMDWKVDPTSERLQSVRFLSRHRVIELACDALFVYKERTVNKDMLRALITAGIVFDGKIVIDKHCQTNDPFIYAAGPCTKYQRKYYADHMNHEYFNSMEIGMKLAKNIKHAISGKPGKVDLFDVYCATDERLVYNFNWPLITACQLPGDLHYVYIRKPGKPIPMVLKRDEENYGFIMRTGHLNNLKKKGYFRIFLNENDEIETITCLAKNQMHPFNLIHLWGKHESLLNNLKTRFKAGLISDLFDFFEEPWASALYHPTFKEVHMEFNDVLKKFFTGKNVQIFRELQKLFKARETTAATALIAKIIEKFFASEYLAHVKSLFIDYLIENVDVLRMYAQPEIVRFLLKDYENSPLFGYPTH